jgi:integrase
VDKIGLVDAAAGRFRPHGLRKTAITVWLDAGVPIEEAAAWCGHKNVTVMYKHYKARQADLGRAQISKVDAVLRASADRKRVSSTSRVDRILSS